MCHIKHFVHFFKLWLDNRSSPGVWPREELVKTCVKSIYKLLIGSCSPCRYTLQSNAPNDMGAFYPVISFLKLACFFLDSHLLVFQLVRQKWNLLAEESILFSMRFSPGLPSTLLSTHQLWTSCSQFRSMFAVGSLVRCHHREFAWVSIIVGFIFCFNQSIIHWLLIVI